MTGRYNDANTTHIYVFGMGYGPWNMCTFFRLYLLQSSHAMFYHLQWVKDNFPRSITNNETSWVSIWCLLDDLLCNRWLWLCVPYGSHRRVCRFCIFRHTDATWLVTTDMESLYVDTESWIFMLHMICMIWIKANRRLANTFPYVISYCCFIVIEISPYKYTGCANEYYTFNPLNGLTIITSLMQKYIQFPNQIIGHIMCYKGHPLTS